MTEDDSTADTADTTERTDTTDDDTNTVEPTRSLTRRGAIATLATLGLLGSATQSTSAASTTLEFGGNYTADPGSNYGLRLAPDNARFGLLAFSTESNGRGVVGRASSSTGTTVGVLGRSDSSSDGAAGLQGFNDATSGRTYGFKGRSDSPSGRGALGIATANSGTTIGLEGRADSTSGVAVKGISTTNGQTAETYGVEGVTQADADAANDVLPSGVVGRATGSDVTVPVFGRGTSKDTKAIVGDATKTGAPTPTTGAPMGVVGITDRSGADSGVSAGYGVVGSSFATSGQAYGVFGNVASGNSSSYAVFAKGDARTAGTHEVTGDIQADGSHNLTVDGGTRALTLTVPDTDSNGDTAGSNVVAGHPNNGVENGAVGAVVAGGGNGGGVGQNVVFDNYGTIGGGSNNEAGEFSFDDDGDPTTRTHATVGGGDSNSAVATAATVGGGESNRARGAYATVPGGQRCVAETYCLAAGRRAQVTSTAQGVFIWADSQNADFKAADEPNFSGVTGSDTFKARSQGGVLFLTNGGSTYIPGDSTGWSTASSRAFKTNIDPVDTETVLDGVEELDVATWEYENDDGGTGIRQIGPMAEEFHEAFDVGDSDEHINSINADGVLFAAVQELKQKLEVQDDRVDELETENERLQNELEEHEERINEKAAHIEELEARLNTLEETVGGLTNEDSRSAPPADD